MNTPQGSQYTPAYEQVTKPITVRSPSFTHLRVNVVKKNDQFYVINTYKGLKVALGYPTTITLAFNTNDDGIYYGAAFCSPCDNFSRKIGRAIAQGRLNSDKGAFSFIKVSDANELNTSDVLDAIVLDLDSAINDKAEHAFQIAGLPNSWVNIEWYDYSDED